MTSAVRYFVRASVLVTTGVALGQGASGLSGSDSSDLSTSDPTSGDPYIDKRIQSYKFFNSPTYAETTMRIADVNSALCSSMSSSTSLSSTDTASTLFTDNNFVYNKGKLVSF